MTNSTNLSVKNNYIQPIKLLSIPRSTILYASLTQEIWSKALFISIKSIQIGSNKWPYTLWFTLKNSKSIFFQKIIKQCKSQFNFWSIWIMIKTSKRFSCQVIELKISYVRSATIKFSRVVQNFHDFRLICKGKSIIFEQKSDF